MSEPNPTRPRGIEPSAREPLAGRMVDWRGLDVDPEIETARAAVRTALGSAIATAPLPDPAAVVAWAAVELAVQHCLDLALDRLYCSRGAARPSPAALPADLMTRAPAAGRTLCRLLNAPEARTRYIFLEDLLTHLRDGRRLP